ncbi:response regulator [Argonema antarcticum]|uniref:response regulator n=1 Tax=Argonema antarcticum TaxID=2942763 RepID=UPI0020129FAD|nr:response regulator [Argonema antarcticum]MCL1470487.1 response regulator [Argonema antarcticum A004/B2]
MKDKPFILAVDHNRRNLELLGQFLNKEGYQTISAGSQEEFQQALSGETEIGLVLVDISGFDRQIWDLCEKLRDDQIPFLVISPKQSAAIQQESIAHGARSMVVKPLAIREFLGMIRGLMGE